MKTFGLIVPAGKGRTFERNVRNLLADQSDLAGILLPMLVNERSKLTRLQHLILTRLSDGKAPRRAALI